MVIGVPKDIHRQEHRVGLNPFAVGRLARLGHTVLVERDAGVAARFEDRKYEEMGAQIVYGAEEVYQRADVVVRVGEIAGAELPLIREGGTITSFHHLAVKPRERIERLQQLKATLIGYEIIRDAAGGLPVLTAVSVLAGQMAVHLASHYLQNQEGGRGIVLGAAPGIPPATVLILGAGMVGRVAARQAVAAGAHVIMIDNDLAKLHVVDELFQGRVVTVLYGSQRLEKFTAVADVVIGAILIPGGRAPFVVTESMVKNMKAGSVIIDVSIDQGGCVETSRPTTLDHPTYMMHGVVHYCVPNMTANVARAASRALANASLPFVMQLAELGVSGAIAADPGLAQGVYMYEGEIVQPGLAQTMGIEPRRLESLLEKDTHR